jgi:hypothetical protein
MVPGWPSANWLDSKSTHDFDLIFLDPNGFTTGHGNLGAVRLSSNGHPFIPQDSSAFYAMGRREKELASFLQAGGDVVIFANPPVLAEGYEGTYSGWDLLPTQPDEYTISEGTQVEVVDDGPIGRYLKENIDQIQYRVTFSAPEWNDWKPLAVTSRTRLCIGAVWQQGDQGRLIVLPWMKHSFGQSLKEPTESAIGEIRSKLAQAEASRFWIPLVQAISKSEGDKQEPPDWANLYRSSAEDSAHRDVKNQEVVVDEEAAILSKAIAELTAASALKPLLYADGDELVDACRVALEILGGESLEVAKNRADLAFKFPGWSAVVEVKGLTNSAKESNAAQLEKWAAEQLEKDSVESKAILLVNAYRTIDPLQRSEPAFPHQMIEYSSKRGHVLITTAQLFVAIDRVQSGKETAEEFLMTVRDTIGVMSGYEIQAAEDEGADTPLG